ncbi:MAG: hypothetical protein AB7T22_06650 [Calditrichaceae bacterium]
MRLLKLSTLTLFSLLILMSCGTKENKESGAPAASAPDGEVIYTAPNGWVAQTPGSSFRKAEYALPGMDGKDAADLGVFFFPGTGGSVQDNLERWYGQIKQPDGSSTSAKAEIKKISVGSLPVTMVYVTGTYMKSSSGMMMGGPVDELPGYAMLAAIVETANGPWFFKITGPQETVDYWRPTFGKFVNTFRIKKTS